MALSGARDYFERRGRHPDDIEETSTSDDLAPAVPDAAAETLSPEEQRDRDMFQLGAQLAALGVVLDSTNEHFDPNALMLVDLAGTSDENLRAALAATLELVENPQGSDFSVTARLELMIRKAQTEEKESSSLSFLNKLLDVLLKILKIATLTAVI